MHLRGKLSLPGWESSRGESHRQAKLTEDIVRDIRMHDKAKTMTREQLGKKHGISAKYVGDIARRKRWGHVV